MKIGKWGEISRGETSFGEKRHTCANFGKKWGEMIFGEKRHREKCRGEKRHLGRNVFPPLFSINAFKDMFFSVKRQLYLLQL